MKKKIVRYKTKSAGEIDTNRERKRQSKRDRVVQRERERASVKEETQEE